MFRMSRTARLLAAVAGVAALHLPAPAMAGGGFSVTLTPKGEQAQALRTGLTLYSIFNSVKNSAKVTQYGSNNGAAVAQSGKGNVAGIFQIGKGHSATASQNGNYNGLGILQLGKKTTTTASQSGNGNLGFIIQGGW